MNDQAKLLPFWRPKLPFGTELTRLQCANVREAMKNAWNERGCADHKKPACWVVGPSGQLLRR